jgi:hypothetical protein
MKITLEPTAEGMAGEYKSPTVTIQVPSDSLIIHDVIDDLVRPALIAWGGIHPDTVAAYFTEQ